MAVVQTMGTMGGLDPQECFNKALETVAALKPAAEAKTYTIAELQRLRAACSLTVAGKGHNIASVPCPSACRRTHQTRDGSGTRAGPKTCWRQWRPRPNLRLAGTSARYHGLQVWSWLGYLLPQLSRWLVNVCGATHVPKAPTRRTSTIPGLVGKSLHDHHQWLEKGEESPSSSPKSYTTDACSCCRTTSNCYQK
jgi:hypothetical protein